jgi:transposase
MAMLADTADAVIGIDTHTDALTACLLDRLGRQLEVITIPADPVGFRTLLAWAQRTAPRPQLAWAIEGTRSHGLGLTRYLLGHGQLMIGAERPARASKRPGGKSDPADAARAARDALYTPRLAQPRRDGPREVMRILLTARAQAATARTPAVNTLKALLLGAPDELRHQLRGLSTPRQASRCRNLRVRHSQPVAQQILRAELRRLATHIRHWDRELRANKAQLRQLVQQVMPALLDQPRVGPISAAPAHAGPARPRSADHHRDTSCHRHSALRASRQHSLQPS